QTVYEEGSWRSSILHDTDRAPECVKPKAACRSEEVVGDHGGVSHGWRERKPRLGHKRGSEPCCRGSSILRIGDADRRGTGVLDLEREGPGDIGPDVGLLHAARRDVPRRTEMLQQGVDVGAEIHMVEAKALRRSGTGNLQGHDLLLHHSCDEIRISIGTFEK